MKVDQFDIFAIDAARGVTGHHDSRRRDNHHGQSGEHETNQFQGALVCHCSASFRRRSEKPGRRSDQGLSSLWQFHLVNSVNQIIADAADTDHGRDGPEQKNWHLRFLLIGCPHHQTQVCCHLFPMS
jgi:hypothetical protein